MFADLFQERQYVLVLDAEVPAEFPVEGTRDSSCNLTDVVRVARLCRVPAVQSQS